MQQEIGRRVREARREAKLRPAEFCVALGISPSTLQRWETGRTPPSVSDLLKIAELTGRSLSSFLPDADAVKVA